MISLFGFWDSRRVHQNVKQISQHGTRHSVKCNCKWTFISSRNLTRAYRSQSRSFSFLANSAAVESCLLGIETYQNI